MSRTRIYLEPLFIPYVRSDGRPWANAIQRIRCELRDADLLRRMREYPTPSIGFCTATDASGTKCYLEYDCILPELPINVRRCELFQVTRVAYMGERLIDSETTPVSFEVIGPYLETALTQYENVVDQTAEANLGQ